MKKTITDIEGVYANGIAAGIKPGKMDMAYISVPSAVSSAGVFTRNQFIAPCLQYTQKCLKTHTLKAVIINSGNANAGTGDLGYQNAKTTAKCAQKFLGLSSHKEIGIASTGIIGVQLPMDKIEAGVTKLLQHPQELNGAGAAKAIMTTDLVQKEVYLEDTINQKTIAIAGIAKGSGMIAPNMGTMLGFFVTNAHISQKDLQACLKTAVEESFNMISVDNDTSTNDMALLFSTGAKKINLFDKETKEQFQSLLTKACIHLAKMIAKDGEGAERLIEVEVTGAVKKSDAKKIALNIINSPLVKTAIHGADPNWGRIIAAAAKDPDIKLNPKKLELKIQNQLIFQNEQGVDFDREMLVQLLKESEIKIQLDLHIGKHRATAWGCDLTKKYIDINTCYC